MASRFRKVRGILSSNTDGADFPDGLPNGKKSEENLIQNLSKEIDEMRESRPGGCEGLPKVFGLDIGLGYPFFINAIYMSTCQRMKKNSVFIFKFRENQTNFQNKIAE
jgi:hypothetical protein